MKALLRCSLKYCEKREHQCGDDVVVVVYVKSETKPFTQNAYLSHLFLEGRLSRLTQERTCASNKQTRSFSGVDANIVIFIVIVLGVNRA